MKRILFLVVCLSVMLAALAEADTSDKNVRLPQVAKGSNLPAGQAEQKESNDRFPLHDAVGKSNIEMVKELIAKGYKVDTRLLPTAPM
jgi:hypothetical protein